MSLENGDDAQRRDAIIRQDTVLVFTIASMNPPLRDWLRLLLPLSFVMSIWFTVRSRVAVGTVRGPSDFAGEIPILNIYGFPFGYTHAKDSVSAESMVYVMPLLGNALTYSVFFLGIAWLVRGRLRQPKRWIKFIIWIASILTLAFIVLLAGIGDWQLFFPYEHINVMKREVSIGLPIDTSH